MRFTFLLSLILASLLAGPACAQTLANALVPAWNQSIGGYSAEVEGNIIYLGVDDINNDGYGEVIAITGASIATADPTESNRVYCFSENGTLLWVRGFENEIKTATMFDVDRDGSIEVILGTGQTIQHITRGTVEVVDGDGTKLNSIKFNGIIRSLIIDDFENDRYPEMVGVSRNTVYVFDRMGSPRWSDTMKASPPPDPLVAVTDFVGDSRLEVIIGGYEIRVLNHSGMLEWGKIVVEDVTGKKGDRVERLAVGNIISTGRKQVLFSTARSDVLYLYGLEPTEKERNRLHYIEKWSHGLPSKITALKLIDVDGDDEEEILYADESEMFYVLEGNGKQKWSHKLYGRVTDMQVADINNDYDLEVMLVSTSGSIQVLDALDGALIWDYSIPEPIRWISINNLDLDEINEVIIGTLHRNIHVFGVNESFTELFEANSYYQLGQRYFMDGKYNESLKYLNKAKRLYAKYERRGELLRVEELIGTINEAVYAARKDMADVYYEKAVQFFIDENFLQSKTFAEDAKTIYEEFGDTRNSLKAELLLIRIDEKLSKEAGEPTDTLPANKTSMVVEDKSSRSLYVIFFVLVLIITIVLLGVAYKRRRATSKQDSKAAREYEKRMENILEEDLGELNK